MADNANGITPGHAQWGSAIGRLAAAEERMEALNGPGLPSNSEMDAAGNEYGEAVAALLRCPAPDADALRAKLELLLVYEEDDGPLLASPDDRAAVLADFDRIAASPAQPVNHERAASRIQELAIQAAHVQAAAEGVLHDDGNAPEAALALLPLAARLVAEIAAIAQAIEGGREPVDMAAPRLAMQLH